MIHSISLPEVAFVICGNCPRLPDDYKMEVYYVSTKAFRHKVNQAYWAGHARAASDGRDEMVQLFLCGRQDQSSFQSTLGPPPPHGMQKAKLTNHRVLTQKISAGQVQPAYIFLAGCMDVFFEIKLFSKCFWCSCLSGVLEIHA